MEPSVCLGVPFPGFVDTQWPIASPEIAAKYDVGPKCLAFHPEKCFGDTHSAVLDSNTIILRKIADFIGHQN